MDFIEIRIGDLPMTKYREVMSYLRNERICYKAIEDSFLGTNWPNSIKLSSEDAIILKLKLGI